MKEMSWQVLKPEDQAQPLNHDKAFGLYSNSKRKLLNGFE